MKNSIAILILVALFNKAVAQSHGGFEQYYYFGNKQESSLVSVAYFQNAHNWYSEVRYNYEEKNTASLYAGKTFNGFGKIAYTVTPMLGVLIGNFNGGSAGINFNLSYGDVSLSSQVQYIFSRSEEEKNFILNWSELNYEVTSFFKTGLVLQQSNVNQTTQKMDAGFLLGFSYKNWELPLYVFSPASKEMNYVIGISYQWQHKGNGNNQSPVPSVKRVRSLALD